MGFYAEGKEEKQFTGVDWLKAGDRRRLAWRGAMEEKLKWRGAMEEKENRGNRAREEEEEEERELGGGFTRVSRLLPPFSLFFF